MTWRVQKLLYDTAREVKPEAMVTKIAALDCYLQPTYDLMEMWALSVDWNTSDPAVGSTRFTT